MPDLVVGPTTETSARIWVRGDKDLDTCDLSLTRAGRDRQVAPKRIALSAADDYTGVVDFHGLEAGTDYAVKAEFTPLQIVEGRVRTFRGVRAEPKAKFSFVLSS